MVTLLCVCRYSRAVTRPDHPREQLILAGERLIAERGMGVPLRDVAVAAGQRNNSAVQYHFGSRGGLIEAIIARRQEPLERQRMMLLAEHEATDAADDVPALLDILIRPLFDVPYSQGSTHYARFLQQVRHHPAVQQTQLGSLQWPTLRIVMTRLHRALTHLPASMRHARLSAMASVSFTLLADHEQQTQQPSTETGSTSTDDIISMLVGLLTAQPTSDRSALPASDRSALPAGTATSTP